MSRDSRLSQGPNLWLAIGLVPALGLLGLARAQDPAPDPSPGERQKLAAQARELGERSERLYGEGRLTEALEAADQRLGFERRLHPPTKYPEGHPDLATGHYNLGLVLTAMGRLEPAVKHVQAALVMRQQLYPESRYPDGHRELGNGLTSLGLLQQAMGRYEPALENLQRALAMDQRLYPASKYPDSHSDVAIDHNNLGALLLAMDRTETALEHLQAALAIYRPLYPSSKYPDGHTELAANINNVGLVMYRMGRYEGALDHLQQALAMSRRLHADSKYPDGHHDIASSLNNVGLVLQAMGRYEGALENNQAAVAMNRRLYPESKYPDGHGELATSLISLGFLLSKMGRLEPALSCYQQALAMDRRLYPPSKHPEGHPELAVAHNHLGVLLVEMGRYGPALDHLQQALAMHQRLYPEAKYPDGHPKLALYLRNLGAPLRSMRRYEAALGYCRQALAMHQRLYPEAKYPDGHPDCAGDLNSMGLLLQAMGRYDEALDHFRRALATDRRLYPESRYPDGHPELCSVYGNLGGLLRAMGRYDEALDLTRRALAMDRRLYPESRFPDGHPAMALGHHDMGRMLESMGRDEPALDHLERAVTILSGSVRALSDLSTESEALAFERRLPRTLDALLSASQQLPERARGDRAWPLVWMSRSAVARAVEARQDSLASADLPPAIRERMGVLLGIRRRLARRLVQPLPIDPAALARRDREVAALTGEKERLERDLAREVPSLAERNERDRIGPADLARTLPTRSAYVELLRYTRSTFDPAKPGEVGMALTSHYVAFVVRPGEPAHRVELGPAAPIEEALADWRHAIDHRRDSPAAAVLRRLVWGPLAGPIGREVQTVHLVPDGALARLPWAALPGSKPGTVMLEELAFTVVPHGPFLVQHLRRAKTGPAATADVEMLTVGGVRYDEAPTPTDRPAERLALNHGPDRDGAAGSWPPLRGTERELQRIGELAAPRARVVRGAEASTARLLHELPRTRLAHLATHGFFNEKEFRAEQRRAEEAIRSWQFSMEGPSGLGGAGAGVTSPLSYTGLVLAGANRPETAGPDGGILTGEMILGLDLHRMDLAVLSACQTGLGDVADGECVQNLQRAFHVAGCANVIASLWSVPDESTAALMAVLYEELFRHRKPPLEALRSAQLWVYRNPGRIAERAERGAPRPDKARRLPGTTAAAPSARELTQPERPAGGADRRAPVKDWGAFLLSGPGL